MLRRLLLTAATVAGLVATLAVTRPALAEGTPAVNWAGDLAEAKQLSDRTGKPMLIVFGADWCGFCKKLDAETLAHPQVSRFINDSFVPVHLDLDTQKRAARILEVKTLPCSVVLAPNADQLGRVVGFEEPSSYFRKLTAARGLQSNVEPVGMVR